jgi:hypothetical protein
MVGAVQVGERLVVRVGGDPAGLLPREALRRRMQVARPVASYMRCIAVVSPETFKAKCPKLPSAPPRRRRRARSLGPRARGAAGNAARIVTLSFKHRSSALVYKNMSPRSRANIRGRIEQRYGLVLTDERKSIQKSRRQTMRMAFVTVVCSAVVPVAASLLVLPAAAQDPRACGGYGPGGGRQGCKSRR